MGLIRKGKCATRGFRRPLPGLPIRAAETRAAFFHGAVCAASLGHGLSYQHNFSRLLCYPICLDFLQSPCYRGRLLAPHQPAPQLSVQEHPTTARPLLGCAPRTMFSYPPLLT